MNDPQHPATTVLCLCDQVAPQFLFSGEQSNNYYPENVIATDQGMDYDKTGQSYGPSSQLSCPSPQVGCEYDLAFGIGDIGTEEPKDNDPGSRSFGAGGRGRPPGSGGGETPTSPARVPRRVPARARRSRRRPGNGSCSPTSSKPQARTSTRRPWPTRRRRWAA